MDVSTVILSVILLGLFWLWLHLTRFRGDLESMNLPLVKPFLCLGSPPLVLNKTFMYRWYMEKHKCLGNTFARYDGVTPSIVTIDPEIIKEVTVKQFDNFTDRVNWKFVPQQTTLDLSR